MNNRFEVTFEEIEIKLIYQCQCCVPGGHFTFRKTDTGLCPIHGYPLHEVTTFGDYYRSLRSSVR